MLNQSLAKTITVLSFVLSSTFTFSELALAHPTTESPDHGAIDSDKTDILAPLTAEEESAFFEHIDQEGSLDQDAHNLIEPVQWGRVWTCFARNRRGVVFSGRSSSQSQARRIAMSRCTISSSACVWRGCR